MSLNIIRVLALPALLAANTIYMVQASETELQVVTVGNSAADVRSTLLTTTVDGKLTALNTALTGDIATAKAEAIAAAAQDATSKADAAQAAAIAAAATDATTKAGAAQQAAIDASALDATAKANAAQTAAISAAAQDATTKADSALASAKSYTDGALGTAIGNLDLSNSAQLVADIAARDALELTKNSFVLVSDASADPTVDVGAALYFYNMADDSYLKIAEYESLDLVIPNKAILEQFSDVNDQLYYKGVPVATVQAGTNEW